MSAIVVRMRVCGVRMSKVCVGVSAMAAVAMMTMTEDEAQQDINNKADRANDEHEATVHLIGFKEAANSEADKNGCERPDEDKGDESAEHLCARIAKAHKLRGREACQRDSQQGDKQTSEIGE